MRTRKEDELYEEVKRFGDALEKCRTELDITKAKSGRRKKALKALNRSYLTRESEWDRIARRNLILNNKLERSRYDADAYRAKTRELDFELAVTKELLKEMDHTCDSWIQNRIDNYEFMVCIKEILAKRHGENELCTK